MKKSKIITIAGVLFGVFLIGFFTGALWQQHIMIEGIIDFGESITGNNIVIDINETVFADALMTKMQEIKEEQTIS